MKQVVFVLSILFTSLLFLSNTNEEKVYVCTGGSAYAYHKYQNCRGLKRCKSSIKYVTLSEAYEMGRKKPCGYCYK